MFCPNWCLNKVLKWHWGCSVSLNLSDLLLSYDSPPLTFWGKEVCCPVECLTPRIWLFTFSLRHLACSSTPSVSWCQMEVSTKAWSDWASALLARTLHRCFCQMMVLTWWIHQERSGQQPSPEPHLRMFLSVFILIWLPISPLYTGTFQEPDQLFESELINKECELEMGRQEPGKSTLGQCLPDVSLGS